MFLSRTVVLVMWDAVGEAAVILAVSKARNGRARGDGAVCVIVGMSGVCELADWCLLDDWIEDALEGLYLWYGSRDEICDEANCSAMLRVGETGEGSFEVLLGCIYGT